VLLLALPACNGGTAALHPCKGAAGTDEVCVQGGEFTLGHDAVDPSQPQFADYAPVHRVSLDPFFIDKEPVTNAQYKACVDAGMCPSQPCQPYPCMNAPAIDDPAYANYPTSGIQPPANATYCRWKGKRLPTEAEWERAARGPTSFDYPWGNAAPDCSKVQCGRSTTAPYVLPIGSNPGDVSPEGALEMATAVWELTQDYYHPLSYATLTNPSTNPVASDPCVAYTATTNKCTPQDFAAHGNMFYHPIDPNFSYAGQVNPVPAWVRVDMSAGGFRCARSDGGAL
jgi:formylglycine-generating enzyme required for sulfatase activity